MESVYTVNVSFITHTPNENTIVCLLLMLPTAYAGETEYKDPIKINALKK